MTNLLTIFFLSSCNFKQTNKDNLGQNAVSDSSTNNSLTKSDEKLNQETKILYFEDRFGSYPNQISFYQLDFQGNKIKITYKVADNEPSTYSAQLKEGKIVSDDCADCYFIKDNQLCVKNPETDVPDCYKFIRNKSTNDIENLLSTNKTSNSSREVADEPTISKLENSPTIGEIEHITSNTVYRQTGSDPWRKFNYFQDIHFYSVSEKSFKIVSFDYLTDFFNNEIPFANFNGMDEALFESSKYENDGKMEDGLTYKQYVGALTVKSRNGPTIVQARVRFIYNKNKLHGLEIGTKGYPFRWLIKFDAHD